MKRRTSENGRKGHWSAKKTEETVPLSLTLDICRVSLQMRERERGLFVFVHMDFGAHFVLGWSFDLVVVMNRDGGDDDDEGGLNEENLMHIKDWIGLRGIIGEK